MTNTVTVAACQVPDIHEDVEQSLRIIREYAAKAETAGAQLVCFPEAYLQGYVLEAKRTQQLAFDLSSSDFGDILKQLKDINTILIFGLIEMKGRALYNTAVVVKQGKLLGYYRKTNLLSGEKLFTAGCTYPVFQLSHLTFGINICYDLNFPESAAAIAEQGAHLLVCPSNNMMRYDTAEKWKYKHNPVRAERAVETGLWLISSDVTGQKGGRISYGPTALINPQGGVTAQVPLLEEGLIVQDIVFLQGT